MDSVYTHTKMDYYTSQLQEAGVLGNVIVEFAAADTAEKKFTVTNDALRDNGVLCGALQAEFHGASPFAAKSIRLQGNDFFKSKHFERAIIMYTASILRSQPGTESWSFALANRSAALYRIKDYANCLKDIDRTLNSSYPVALAYKLYERAGRAECFLGRCDVAKRHYAECSRHVDLASISEEAKTRVKVEMVESIEKCGDTCPGSRREETVPQVETTRNEVLVGGANDSIPAFSKCLELKYTESMGRGVYATRDINPGDVVAIEEPYVCAPMPEFGFVCNYTYCLKCTMTVIPCMQCFQVVYCNEDCMQKAYEEGHSKECSILCSLIKLPGTLSMNATVLRWFFVDYSKFGLKKYCSRVKQLSNASVDSINRGFDENGKYKSDSFFTAYTLDYNENKISIDDLFFLNCISVEMVNFVTLSGIEIPRRYLPTVGASFVHMLKILSFNFGRSYINSLRLFYYPDNNIQSITFFHTAFGLYPSICLFNHSCDPNVDMCGILNARKKIYKAIQPIPKGDQLFICYDFHFKRYDRQIRQNNLMDIYKFKCSCQPCQENWPIMHLIPNRLSPQIIINKDLTNVLVSEFEKFMDFKEDIDPLDYILHLDYLNSFVRLLFRNVKRPFFLYEECLTMIDLAHMLLIVSEGINLVQSSI